MDSPRSKIETHFEAAGSLPRPGLVGRLVRFLLGLSLMWGLYAMVSSSVWFFTANRPPSSWSFWFFAVVAFLVTPYVVNIGFGKSWRRWPRVVVGAIAAIMVVASLVVYESWWSPLVGVFVWAWLIYFALHLGISFLVSAVIATPGCEMRALPHLWTVISGKETKEHYCPGPLDRIDAWERHPQTPGSEY